MKISADLGKPKKKAIFYRQNQKGIVLILSMVFLSILALLGSTAVVLTTTDMKIGDNYKQNAQAVSAAQAGIAEARNRLKGTGTTPDYAGDTGAPIAPWWSAYILTSDSWDVTTDDPEYDSSYQNNFPSGGNYTDTIAAVNTIQSPVGVDYSVKIRHKREWDAIQAGHVAGTSVHYQDRTSGTPASLSDPQNDIIYFGDDPSTTGIKEWVEFTHAAPGDARPVEIVRSYGLNNGSEAVVEVEVRLVPLDIDTEAAVYTAGNLTGNGSALFITGMDQAGSTGAVDCGTGYVGDDVQPYYLYDDPTDATTPVVALNGVDETDDLQGDPDDPAQRIGGIYLPINEYVEAMGLPGSASEIITSDQNGASYGADGNGNSVVCYSDTSDPYNVGGLKLSNVDGYGILAVKGDLEMGGGFRWHGLVLCTGTLTFNGGGAGINITGAVLANQTVTINGGVNVRYDSCYVREALAANTAQVSRWRRVY